MSRTQAINDKCRDCIYDPKSPGTWREQVEKCTSENRCALWPYRPMTTETLLRRRDEKNSTSEIDIHAIVDSLDDEKVSYK